MSSRVLYTALIALLILQRCSELTLSKRNARRLRARGGIEFGAGHYPAMVALHTLFPAACLLEVWGLNRPFLPWLATTMLILLGGASILRIWAIRALGERWCTRVIVLPGAPRIRTGPYRWLHHPNYLAVVLELFAIPMIHTAWMTAILFGIANALLLGVRIHVENAALQRESLERGAAGAAVKGAS